jgi:hypothetical protein
MKKCFYIDDSGLEYEKTEYATGVSYFSYETKLPLGTVRYIDTDLCYLFSCRKITKFAKNYKLHWLKI